MKWVLLAVLFYVNVPHDTVTFQVEFSSKQKCEAAMAILKGQLGLVMPTSGKNPRDPMTFEPFKEARVYCFER